MKRVLSYMLAALTVITLIFTGCKEDQGPVAVTGVTLNEPTLTLTEGGQETLEATVAPADAADKNVTWSSSNEAVATVTGGVVTAVAEGQATITVTTVDGKKTATCAVTVNRAAVAVTGISLNKETVTLLTGGSETLTWEVLPTNATDKSVTWSSNNEAVATVEAGVVTAVAPGETKITATANDGSGKTAECTVNVTAPYITVITVKTGSFDFWIAGSGEATIDWGDGSEMETVTLTPLTKGDILYIWDTQNKSQSYPHTYTAEGSKTVTVKGTDITGFYSHYSNGITAVDVTHLPGLLSLDVSSEQLTALDISGNPLLNDLYCFYNQIAEFTIGVHPDLHIIGCDTNNMSRETLVKIFNALPMRAEDDGATMWCGYNPGFEELTEDDYKIANDKNWGVYVE